MSDIFIYYQVNMGKEVITITKLEALPVNSKQKPQSSNQVLKRTPPIDFNLLSMTVNGSFIIGGIISKLGVVADSGFVEILEDTEGLDKIKVKQLNELLRDLDSGTLMMSMATYGNAWIEIAKSQGSDGSIDLIPFASVECAIDAKDNLVQTPKDSVTGVTFEPGTFIHLKRQTLSSRYYGDSIFTPCTDQIALLQSIDSYYADFFDRGLIRTKLLIDVEGKLDEKGKKVLKSFIEDRMKGGDQSFGIGIAPCKLEELKIEDEMDIKGMREYRLDLIKSIAIALNIPYDLLLTDSGNRATSEASLEMFNQQVVKPLQLNFVRQLRKQLRPHFGDVVDYIEMVEIDTKNQKEEMEVLTGYKNAGVFTANMVLGKLGEESVEGGDVLSTRGTNYTSDEIIKVKKIKEELSKVYTNL